MPFATQSAPSKRPGLAHRRNASSRLNLQAENMDLSSFTGIRHASETYVNTRRNRSQAGRTSSSSSLPCVSSKTVQPITDSAPSQGRKDSKVRFVHPVVTAVIEPKVYGANVRFAEPLTNIPPRSKEERAGLRLPGTPYQMNDGPICDNAPGHYSRMCICFADRFPEYSEEGYAEPFRFKYTGPVYTDANGMSGGSQGRGSKMRGATGKGPEEDVWEHIQYGIAL